MPRNNNSEAAEIALDSNRISRIVLYAEYTIAAALLTLAIVLHFRVLHHAGGLWRDEVNSVNLVSLPSLSAIWGKLEYDSFPLLWLVVLRSWIHVGLGGSDLALRTLGLLTGLLSVGAMWTAMRSMGVRVPLVSFVLFAFCPTSLTAGDSLRAYGMGAMFALLNVGMMWRMINRPTIGRVLAAALVAVCSVQCVYQNCVLVAALVAGSAALAIRRRKWKMALLPFAIGLLAAVSVVPYLNTMSRIGAWNALVKVPVKPLEIVAVFAQAIDPDRGILGFVWIAVAILAFVACLMILLKPTREPAEERKDLATFLLTSLVASSVGYLLFLKFLSYTPQVWYYLPLIAFLSVLLDAALDLFAGSDWRWRVARIVCAAAIVCLTIGYGWKAAHTRHTNVDLVAAQLNALAAKDDLIVVGPAWPGVTFMRYYQGPSDWVTIPDISDHRTHRLDLAKEKMLQEPVTPVMERVARTLSAGHRVWFVGGLHPLPPGQAPERLPPPPLPGWEWNEWPYYVTWSRQVAYVVQTHAQKVSQVPVPCETPIAEYENLPLLLVEGWH